MRHLLALLLLVYASQSLADGPRQIIINSQNLPRVVSLFQQIAALDDPQGTSASATCGYIFTGDPNKFGCKGTGRAASDVAAACSGGGQLSCSGSGSSRTCTCAFD